MLGAIGIGTGLLLAGVGYAIRLTPLNELTWATPMSFLAIGWGAGSAFAGLIMVVRPPKPQNREGD